MKSIVVSILVSLFVAVVHAPAAGPLLITEILPDNTRTLADEDGEYSDWIEIHNPTGGPINLLGWRLTDDPSEPGKWTFPSVNLPSGGYLIVFASGKDRTNNPTRLHTNFQLAADGEYLALIQPDGQISQQFAPAFPPQVSDVSYGTALITTTTRLVTNQALARWTVPASALDYPLDWTSTNFLDSAWNSGPTGLGFTSGNSTPQPVGGTATNVALNKPASQSSTLSGFTPDLAVNGVTSDFTHTASGQNLPATWSVNLGTNYGIERIVLYNRESCCGSRLRDITVRILSPTGATNYTSPLLNPENTLGSGLNGPATLTLNLTQLTGGLVLGAQVQVIRTPDPDLSGSGGQGNADEANVLSLAEVQVLALPLSTGSFNSLVQTDLGSAMSNVNASALIRLPFQVVAEELPPLDQLTLRMNYDDGFVAYLNGVKIAEANAPATPAWNSSATAEHPNPAAFVAEPFNLTLQAGLLQDGVNVLAIQGLNLHSADADFLVLPELTGVSSAVTGERYFTQPTPGAVNSGGSLGVVADTKFSVDRGFYEVPFSLSITTATAGASIYYTTNGSAPSELNGLLHTGPITINRTTVIRAIATKPGYTSSDVDTHTYVFLNDIIAQSQASVTAAGYPASWAGVTADYAMDTRITSSNATRMVPSLRSLPSLFISTSISNLFDATSGIYARPTTHGVAWERPASLEMVDTNGATEFHENAGLRIQGGYFRDPNVTQKHSFRVLFKSIYGAGKLRHDLFQRDDAVEEFDGFVLRAGANDGYSWNEARDTEQFTRNQFGHELQGAMGHSGPHGIFLHLYLNGVYWGLYNLVERPNEDLSASYFGGDPLEWDSNNAGEMKNGDLNAWNSFISLAQTATDAAAYQRLLGNNLDGSRNPAYPVYLDRFNYIDYMIVNIWGGNWDWPNKNFWFGRKRTADSTGFKFYVWDFENTMGNNRARSPISMVSPRTDIANTWVGQPHFYLKNNPEYRMDFADQVQRYFFNEGLLTSGNLTNRYRALADWVELSIYSETARWGDDNWNPPQDFDDWRRERDWILGSYLVQRSDVVMQQFRAAGLYPNVGAPFFSSYGGFVSPEAQLTVTQTNSGGVIYYTVDGSDPRRIGGELSPTAQLYTAPVPIGGNALVKARVRVGTSWSALVRANFTTSAYFKDLAVTEIMYNPPGTATVLGDEFEFIELKNTGGTELNLGGLAFTSGITFAFTNGTRLAPGAFFVLARNAAQFQARYPGVAANGQFTGRLDNAGETIRLSHVIAGSLFGVTYDDDAPWPLAPDGLGFSLVPVSLTTNLNSDQPLHWRASSASGGSPGADDPAPGIPSIVVNEVLTHTFVGQDFIELHNPTAAPAAVGGWFLTDDKGQPQKFRIPDGTIIPAGGFIVFTEADFNPAPGLGASFTLNAESDAAYLFSGNSVSNLTGYSHGFAFGAAPDGITFGRYISSIGEEQFPLQSAPTPGAANAGPAVGPLVLSEIHYNPRPGDIPFVEVKNVSVLEVKLFDEAAPTNTWRINGIGFDFPPGLSIPAGQFILVVASEPAAFRSRYNVAPSVPVFGPYAGGLQDSGERLELQRPDFRGTNGNAFVTVDEVRYNDRAPWPSAADGVGPSLQRLTPQNYGNDPINWRAAAPTPGRDYVSGVIPTITQHPVNATVVATREATFSVTATGPGALSFQWRMNGSVIAGATNSLLLLTNLQLNHAGAYTAIVYNDAGSVESLAGMLSVLVPANILQQPGDVLVRIKPDPQAAPTTNATFTVQATSTSPIRYQWRFNGAPLLGQTNFSLTVSNVQLADAGLYSVEITDAAGTIFSSSANLYPLIVPGFAQLPLPQTVPVGGLVTLSTVVTGSPAPFTLEWRRSSLGVATNLISGTQGFYSFVAPNYVTNLSYRVVVRNLASPPAGVPSPFAAIAVVADSDGDGLPDDWETLNGLNPASSLDAVGDKDSDGVSNRQEYDAGTDPNNPSSFLSVALNVSSGSAVVSFGAVSNRTYSVQFRDDLEAPWQTLADVVSRPVNRVETFPDTATNELRFYRVTSPQRP